MILRIRKTDYLNEVLGGDYKDKLDDLEAKKGTNGKKLSFRQEAEYKLLKKMEAENTMYDDSYPMDKFDRAVDASMPTTKQRRYARNGKDSFVNKTDKNADEVAINTIPGAKKDIYYLFMTLSELEEKEAPFVKMLYKCFDEMSPNSLYWLCYDFTKAPRHEKYKAISDFLGQYEELVGNEHSVYSTTRAFLQDQRYVDRFMELYKPYAGSRPPKGKPEKPVNVPKPDKSDKDDGDDEKESGSTGGGKKKDKRDDKPSDEDKKDDKEKGDETSTEDLKVFVYDGRKSVDISKADKYTGIRVEKGVSIILQNAFHNMYKVKEIFWFGEKERKTGLFRTGDTTARKYADSLPPTVKQISKNAFSGCIALEKLILPSSIVTIGDNAFNECKLTEFNIGQNAVNISKSAFNGLKNKATIIIDARSRFYASVQELIKNGKLSSFSDYFENKNLVIKISGEPEKRERDKQIKHLMDRAAGRRW